MPFLLALMSFLVKSANYNLDQTSTIAISCKEPSWLTISSIPNSGYLWYSPSNEYILQEDALGLYDSGFQYFNVKCSENAQQGHTYGINFYYIDGTYNLIHTLQVSVYVYDV